MTRVFSKKSHKNRRRYLRKNMTKAEVKLWNYLRKKNILKQRFLRQFSIGNYVVDFYCPKLKLAIEIDGSTHLGNEQIKYDRQRQEEVESLGVVLIRFWNDDVYKSLEGVVRLIEEKIEDLMKIKKPL
ncbi:MAG: endonuclease domain-containing protein [Ignavibacteria bacterium]